MRQFLKDFLMWGFILWLIGYILGFVFFALVPADVIGWYIMPFGIVITFLVAFKLINSISWQYYLKVACVWTIMAIILDYFFLVKLLNPVGGYYKLDVYVYYSLTFILPFVVGLYKNRKLR